jgi:hypothetical protein
MCDHRKIDYFSVVTSMLPSELANGTDFSRASIRARIQAGYEDAKLQGIGCPDSPGLRSDTVGDWSWTGDPGLCVIG